MIFFSPLAEYFMQSIHPIITAEALIPAALVNSDPRDSSTAGTGSFDVDTLGNVFCAGCERDKVAFERRVIPESSWPLQEQFPLLLALMGSEVPEGEKFHSTLSKQADQSVCHLCSTHFFFS